MIDAILPAAAESAAARPARRCVSLIFLVNGAVVASWVPHIPAVKASHGLGDGQLGLVLLTMALGAVLALPLAGGLVGRLGSRRTTMVAAVALCLALPLPLLSPSIARLCLALFFFGAANGTLDVAMNAQAIGVERRYARPIMSSFHALFSLGGVAGAALASLAMWGGVGGTAHLLAAAGASLTLAVLALPGLLRSATGSPAPAALPFARPSRMLLGLGGLAFLGLLAEGAMGDWSAVYLRDSLGATSAVAAVGFAAFSLAMAVGRFAGDRVVARVGPARVLRGSGVIGAVGLGGALLVGEPGIAVVGCGLVGLGIATVVPILFSAAGRVRGVPAGTALAAVATPGYVGFLAGPPLIGLAAELTSLPVALGIVSACCALIAAGAGALDRRHG